MVAYAIVDNCPTICYDSAAIAAVSSHFLTTRPSPFVFRRMDRILNHRPPMNWVGNDSVNGYFVDYYCFATDWDCVVVVAAVVVAVVVADARICSVIYVCSAESLINLRQYHQPKKK